MFNLFSWQSIGTGDQKPQIDIVIVQRGGYVQYHSPYLRLLCTIYEKANWLCLHIWLSSLLKMRLPKFDTKYVLFLQKESLVRMANSLT